MAETVNMPRLGLNEATSVIGEWHVAEGDKVKAGDALFTIETDKSTMTVAAESAGVVLKKLYGEYDAVEVMTPVCIIGEENEDIAELLGKIAAGRRQESQNQEEQPKAAAEKNLKNAGEVRSEESASQIFVSPRAKKLAAANGIGTSGIIPTGAEGRIVEEDIIAFMKGGFKEAAPAKARTVKMSNIRRLIAKNMLQSLQNTAQLTSHTVFNASAILAYRERAKNGGGAEKGITIGDMVVFAAIKTLTAFDYMNAHLVSEEEMLFFSDVNLGVAVDTERGLMVPVISEAQNMSLLEVSLKTKELADRCRTGKITPEEMSGATFTVSNLGGMGVTDFTPIINPPQVGILGVGTIDYAVKKTPEGILCYPSGHLSLTYDHRAVDGAPSARFLKALCGNLEDFENIAKR
jgi:pyruvate dehydrogenase E2 component (dihydrolipoamide acetyltransferase)